MSATGLTGAGGGAQRARQALALAVIALAAVLPLLAGIGELTRAQDVLIYLMVAIGLNIAFGYAGLFAVAQPVVLGTAAYTAAILSANEHVSPWVDLPCSVAAGVTVGFLLCSPGFRRLRGWYLTITTFFATLVFPDVVSLASGLTGGTNGMFGVAPLPGVGFVLGSSSTEYWIILGITVALFAGMYNIYRSSWGVVLRGVRDAPRAAEACGVRVPFVFATVSIVSSFPVAVAGWVFAHSSGVIGPDDFSLQITIIIIAAVVLGGIGTVWGPVIGTVIVEFVSLWVGPFSSYNTLLVGLAVLLIAIATPRGIVPVAKGLLARALAALRARRAAPGAVPAAPAVGAAGTVGAGAVAGDGAAAPLAGTAPAAPAASPTPSTAVGTAPAAATAGERICEVRDLHKHFSGVTVLEGATLSVGRGEVVGLVGPNGSGKTTLLNILTGHVRPDSGVVLLDGRPISRRSPAAIARLGIRRTFQVPRLIGELSVYDNVRLGLLGSRRQHVIGSVLRLPTTTRRARRDVTPVVRACDLVGLGPELRAQRADGLSLGLRRIIEVARAVVTGPAVICLDEPAAGLGGSELERLGRVLRTVAASGTGVLLIEHNLAFVSEVSDRVVLMHEGETVPAPSADLEPMVSARP